MREGYRYALKVMHDQGVPKDIRLLALCMAHEAERIDETLAVNANAKPRTWPWGTWPWDDPSTLESTMAWWRELNTVEPSRETPTRWGRRKGDHV